MTSEELKAFCKENDITDKELIDVARSLLADLTGYDVSVQITLTPKNSPNRQLRTENDYQSSSSEMSLSVL
ncbi:hypothetical protein [Campylobacter sp. 19-13652]|uniref:hypothetical protein n=1 Tax=Campylobacter sp. 19-13652 TaxID=2840180 RepID=UPI001C771352|nr:hypothetical protein [Campylobacter sp. 19-13652]BCX79247.1 hypothetical protein LBC_07090 [Campylobacter sp. 19-13652]